MQVSTTFVGMATVTSDLPAVAPATHGHKDALPKLMLGAVGVVYGDIGTSPLYALQATLDPRYHLAPQVTDLYGIVSLIFWSFVFVVTIKYVFIVMRCDNKGEGGSLALYALIQRQLGAAAPNRRLISAYKARLPPSPLLSQRMTMKTYLIVITKMNAQKIRLTMPYRSVTLVRR